MYGAVFGDIIGSWYEWHNKKSEDIDLFPREARFTDDTVLTVALEYLVGSRSTRSFWTFLHLV